jgi:UDP-GlcNAc:undecaprenyl-phosphate GlcNAc-1-phosphate transferase
MIELIAQTTVSSETPRFSIDAVLSPYVYVFYAGFMVSFLFTPIMRSVAVYYGIVDNPDQRKIHRLPVAYLGGVAVFLGWISALALSQFILRHGQAENEVLRTHIPFSIVLGAILIVSLGLLDDIRSLRPWIKILGQITAAGALLWAGYGQESLRYLLAPIDLRTQVWFGFSPWPDTLYHAIGFAFTIGLVTFCCNATNLMDGLDGLCGGVTAIIAFGYVWLCVYMGMYGGPKGGLNDDAMRIILALALLGAVLGFIPYNFNPASIFMGDAGSMFLGYSCATLILMLAEQDGRWLLASLVMFALPVLDTALAFARRFIAGRPVFSPDKHHFHHQLLQRGLSIRRAVVLSYGLAIAFVVLGMCMVFMRTRYAIALYLVIFGFIVVAAYKMGMVHERPVLNKPASLGSEGSVAETGESTGVLEIRGPTRDT